MSFEGIDEGVAGLGSMNAEGVLGGSVLGINFFHASTNVESTRGSAGRPVENGRRHLIVVALARSCLEPCRNMIVGRGLGGGYRRRLCNLIGRGRMSALRSSEAGCSSLLFVVESQNWAVQTGSGYLDQIKGPK